MSELQEILKRVRSGELNDRDAADLILAREERDGDARHASGRRGRDRRRGSKRSRRARGWDPGGVIEAEGEGFTCEDNRTILSHVDGLKLDDSRFTGNRFNASRISGLRLTGSSFTNSRCNGSQLTRCTLASSDVVDLRVNGGALTELTLADGTLSGVEFNGVKADRLLVDASKVRDSQFNGSSLEQLSVREKCEVDELRLNGTRTRGLDMRGSRIRRWTMAGGCIDGVKVERSTIEECGFKGNTRVRVGANEIVRLLDALRDGRNVPRYLDADSLSSEGVRLKDVRFTDVGMRRCRLRYCRFENVRFSGFEIEDFECDHLELSDCDVTSAAQLRSLAASAGE